MEAPRFLPRTPMDLLGQMVNVPGGRASPRGLAKEASDFGEDSTDGTSPGGQRIAWGLTRLVQERGTLTAGRREGENRGKVYTAVMSRARPALDAEDSAERFSASGADESQAVDRSLSPVIHAPTTPVYRSLRTPTHALSHARGPFFSP